MHCLASSVYGHSSLGSDTSAFGDAGYCGVDKRLDAQEPTWHVAMQPGKRKALDTTRE